MLKLVEHINEPVDLLKVDIEGSEMRVMKNLLEKDKLKFIKHMYFEYHHHIHADQDNLSLMVKILEDNDFGYQIYAGPQFSKENGHFQDISIRAYKKNPLL